jgi:hypothetical protein
MLMLRPPRAGELCWGQVPERHVWPVVVVFEAPVLDEHLGLEQGVEGVVSENSMCLLRSEFVFVDQPSESRRIRAAEVPIQRRDRFFGQYGLRRAARL